MHEKYGTDHGHEHPKQRRAHMSNGIQLTIQTVIHLPKSSTWWNIFCCWMPSAFGCRRLERVRGNAVQVGQGDIGATRQCVRMTLLFFQVRITLLIFWGWSPSSKCLGIYTKRKMVSQSVRHWWVWLSNVPVFWKFSSNFHDLYSLIQSQMASLIFESRCLYCWRWSSSIL